jgi:hypothetical protein
MVRSVRQVIQGKSPIGLVPGERWIGGSSAHLDPVKVGLVSKADRVRIDEGGICATT